MPDRSETENAALRETAAQLRYVLDPSSELLLDNPIWSALSTDHAHIALGGEHARRYPDKIGPLTGMPAQNDEGYDAMRALAASGGLLGLFLCEPPQPPRGWTLVRDGVIDQMIAPQPLPVSTVLPRGVEMRRLTAEDAPAMVELARLTEPGPFRLRTIELGNFFGIVQGGRLLAMAGKRLHLPGFIEVSGVCTHPDARGHGYARVLMSRVIDEILDCGRVPFLHTFAGNDTAIRIYQSLGFLYRRSFELAVLRRDD